MKKIIILLALLILPLSANAWDSDPNPFPDYFNGAAVTNSFIDIYSNAQEKIVGVDNQILQYNGTVLEATSSLDSIGAINLNAIGDYQVNASPLFDDTATGTDSGWTADKIITAISEVTFDNGYVSALPAYSNTPCVAGQYTWDTVNHNDYRCESKNVWDYRDINGLWVDWVNKAPTGITCQGTEFVCEGFGDVVGAPAGWASIGSPDYNYTSAPAPLSGLYSLSITNLADMATSNTFTASSTVYVGFQFNTGALDNPADIYMFSLSDGNATAMSVQLLSTGKIRIRHGTAYETTVVLTPNTTYYLWLDYVAGTGADGIYRGYLGSTGVFADATLITDLANGVSTLSVVDANFLLGGSVMTTPMVFDNLKVASSPVGDL